MLLRLTEWRPGIAELAFEQPGEVHVWSFSLVQPPFVRDVISRSLNSEEAERFGRRRLETDRGRATAARGILREILGSYLGVCAAAVEFSPGAWGKPALAAAHNSDIGFNVSHSGDLGMVAVALSENIGVDVELARASVDPWEVAGAWFSTDEIEQLRALPEGLQREWFLHGWVRKEAYLKADGRGLTVALNSFHIEMDPEIREQRVAQSDGVEYEIARVDPGEGYRGAVAMRVSTARLEPRARRNRAT